MMSMVSRASCRRRSRRSRLLSEEEATPPLPVLPPGRCWKSIAGAAGLYQLPEEPLDAESEMPRPTAALLLGGGLRSLTAQRPKRRL